jgi:hypothetical protein
VSPNDFYDTDVLRKKFVTDAILLTETYLISQREPTIHLNKNPFPEPTIMVDGRRNMQNRSSVKGALSMNSSLILQARKGLCLKKRKGIFHLCSHT